MMESLKSAGADIHSIDSTVIIDSDCSKFVRPKSSFYVGNAGTAMRFLTAFSTLLPGEIELTGDERMKERPIGDLVDALVQLGAEIEYLEKEEYPPLLVRDSKLHGGTVYIRGELSSQFISAVLMIAPCIGEELTIRVDGFLVSKPYIEMTVKLMELFGVHVENDNFSSFTVQPSKYNAQTYTVEGDASSASYYWAMNYLHDSSLKVTNIPENSLQGDAIFKNLIEKMKSKVPDEIDMNDTPDCVQTLAVILATVPKKTRIKNVYNLRVKETDRIHALANELQKVGAKVSEGDDYIEITGSEKLKGAEIETYNDHRMAMSFAVLGTKVPGMKIKNPECVNKSYPTFWQDLEKLGVTLI
jgi:3-phosphoshikimate 1-carboxyvinyltransferase